MSRLLLLITFTGRKSGKQYTTPISYVRQGDPLLLGSVSVGGKTYAGRAEAWTDEASMIRAYQTILVHSPTQARFMGITATADGRLESYDIQQALQRGAAVVEIQLTPGSETNQAAGVYRRAWRKESISDEPSTYRLS